MSNKVAPLDATPVAVALATTFVNVAQIHCCCAPRLPKSYVGQRKVGEGCMRFFNRISNPPPSLGTVTNLCPKISCGHSSPLTLFLSYFCLWFPPATTHGCSMVGIDGYRGWVFPSRTFFLGSVANLPCLAANVGVQTVPRDFRTPLKLNRAFHRVQVQRV